MTNWLPDLSVGSGPLYQRLADSIESDIDKGVIDAGAKLPPQRDLAYDIGTTVGTIGRAYQLLRERGLVSGEVGRGTYVLAQSAGDSKPDLEPAVHGTRPIDAPAGKLRFDSTAAPDIGQDTIIAEMLARTARDHPHEISSYTRDFPERWFEAGSRWLARNSFRPSPDSIVPTLGTHAAVMAAIAALTMPGDYVVFEHLTYSQIARSAGLIGRRTALVLSDDEGIDPDDFERVCAQKHPKVMFLMPTAKNPTLVTMPAERRQAIARVAREYNVVLVEDDLYGDLTDDPTPLLAEYAPERTIVAGGLSKSVAAGVRGGWLSCPPAFRHRIRVAHKMMTGGLPFLLAEVGSRLVMSGEASDIRMRCVAEIQTRVVTVREMLAGFDFRTRDNVPFVWLTLPDPWLSGTFKNACLAQGVLLDDEDEFKAGRSEQVFHGVRFGVSQPRQNQDVAGGVAVIRRLLDEGRAGYDSFS
ncbi:MULTISPECIES: PLP-dependent aminotransferase family protein [unclassified Mesorhizobium]|uniref:aminotransferase-like domain-containing protein n=1 Tax=unclassified Mesorhizobium TaxID=325217 RepID=UPI000BB026F0|nr:MULTISPECIES: PLP-dependent aminotransferase family protein [unclassified Mesorhizobium]TGT59704.1 PLP-dependent aminotransferase family protein [Mesorhizobium sp. M00.F.Ca.ET.170.01.1.1]AZO12708.1 PLP-dependent aminotransferase family protein [Mesorhizobium sp. M3A.F.Ca.ET.080.04.2.1]PBB87162.1 GntR family transcriptional regulator [Mesorhizobium sp. WSM3876]RWB71319.1 MAG: PLP-dependent aminotransferase family protein [Mesorhizobium sp.]RWB91215.1 MAG: PLP-dependent aminotransferase famil